MKKFLVLFLGLSMIFSACATQQEVGKEISEPIKVGAILQMTKEGAIWGQNSKMGIELAVLEVNKKGGVLGRQVEVIYEDNQGDNPRQAVTAYNKLTSVDQVKFILGPSWSPSGLALAPLAQKGGVLAMSPSLGIRDFNESGDLLFNVWPHDDVATKGLADYALKKGWKRVAVLTTTQAWEKVQADTFREYFVEQGGEIVRYEESIQTATDFRAESVRIKQANPDAILVCNYSTQPIAVKNMRDIGITAPFMSILVDDDIRKAAGDYLEGTVVVTYPPPVPGFAEKFRSFHDAEPGVTADTAYDAMNIITSAMKKTSSLDPRVVADEILTLKTYNGASGELIFDEYGGVSKPYVYQQLKDGKLVDVK